jgi:hypothetical protein
MMRPIQRGNADRWKAGLEFKCCWFDAHVLEISVTSTNGEFSGVAHPYISHDGLEKAVAILDKFPENNLDTRELTFGGSGEQFAGGYVNLKFSCRDLAGHGVIEVHIESKNERRSSSTWNQPSQFVRFFATIQPAAVDEFPKELRKLHQTREGTAWLQFARD